MSLYVLSRWELHAIGIYRIDILLHTVVAGQFSE